MTDFTSSPALSDTSVDSFFDQAIHNEINTQAPKDSEQPTNENTDLTQAEVNGFAALGLAPVILKSIVATGYTNPTPIQAQAIPAALAGRDLLLSAQTGSGKTAAFVLPILHQLSLSQAQSSAKRGRNQPKSVKALVLTPTRELAHQVSDSIRKYGSSMRDLFSVPLVGGAAYSGQIRALKKGVQIIIATPGRLLDHINAGRVDLSDLSILVLDEADRMLDMGFADDIEAILKATPADRQTVMSSATWDGPVGKIAESFTKNPERISIKVETAHIDEKVYFCDHFDHKNKLLEHLICDPERGQAIIFTATKRSSEELAERLQGWDHKACYLHGDLPQSKRNRIVADLRSGKYDIVVATDVAARGLDLPNITHVFNYDLPRQVEDYVHRIGRSGRAGRTGIAINLCSRDDRRQFGNISRYLKRDIQEAMVEGLEPKFVDKFDGRGKERSRGRNGNRDDRGGRSRSSNYQGGEKRFADKSSRFGDKERSEKRERFEHSSNDNRFAKNDEFKPRRRRESTHEQGEFSRAAKSFDRPNFDKPSHHHESKERRSDREYQGAKSYQGDKPRFDDKPFGKKTERSGEFRGERKTDSRQDDFRRDDRPRKPRAVVEETFGQAPKHRSDKPYAARDGQRPSNSFKSSGFKKSDKPFAGKSSRGDDFKSKSNGFAKSAKSSDKQDGWDAPKRARRNSTGKPL